MQYLLLTTLLCPIPIVTGRAITERYQVRVRRGPIITVVIDIFNILPSGTPLWMPSRWIFLQTNKACGTSSLKVMFTIYTWEVLWFLKRTVQYTREVSTSSNDLFCTSIILSFNDANSLANGRLSCVLSRSYLSPSLRAFRCNLPPAILRASHRDSCPHSHQKLPPHSDSQLPIPSVLPRLITARGIVGRIFADARGRTKMLAVNFCSDREWEDERGSYLYDTNAASFEVVREDTKRAGNPSENSVGVCISR